MVAGHVSENALLVHQFKTHKQIRLLIRYVRYFIFLCPSLYWNAQPSDFCYLSDARFYTHGGTIGLKLGSFRHFRRPETVIMPWNIIRLVPVFILRRNTRHFKNTRLSSSKLIVHLYCKNHFLSVSLTGKILQLELLLIATACVVL